MCGIAGFLGHFDQIELVGMSQRIAHRGPDGAGFWISENGEVGLAHRRLSIIDLSKAANQPMITEGGAVALTYNGELYNYRELRSTLMKAGFSFRTNSDTEVLLKMYLWKGTEMLQLLNGIFAFAIWDDRSRVLFVARDGVGVKPLYYTSTSRGLLFASELKAFMDIRDVDWGLNPTALRAYMTYHWSPGEETMVRTIKKLLPGHAFIARGDQIVRIWQYYDLPYSQPPRSMKAKDAVELVRESVRSAVERQMVADVPVGAFLSGGLDSSSVVAFAKANANGEQLPCFTIRFNKNGARQEGIEEDLPYARRVAKHLGVSLEEVDVGPEALHLLPKIIYMMDEPQADVAPINTYLISSLARDRGIKVLLSGMGGDDIFSGYRRHYALAQERYWQWWPHSIRRTISRLASQLPVNTPLARKVRKALSYAHLPQEKRIASYFFWENPDLISAMISTDFATSTESESVDAPLLAALERLPHTTAPLNRMLYLEGKFFVPDHNLNFFDKVSMACGVECRVPLLDIELIQAATSLPSKFKQVGSEGKWVFKKAMEPDLPHEAIYRPKTGFGMPLRSWMHEELGEFQEDLLSWTTVRNRGFFDPVAVQSLRDQSKNGTIDGSYTLLSMMSMELWSRIFIDRSMSYASHANLVGSYLETSVV